MHGRDDAIREHTYTEEHEECRREAAAEGRLPVFRLSPDMFRERTPEEMEELRRVRERERAERYRGVYTTLSDRRARRRHAGVDLEGRGGR